MELGIRIEKLADEFPRLYHMAAEGSWCSIHHHGLLSTSALLDLFKIDEADRVSIESYHRAECITISHPEHGTAIIRDQKPMSDARLEKLLQDGLNPSDWYKILNGKVFFWLSEDRLKRLLSTKGYKDQRNTIITVDTRALLCRYADKVFLSPINSGCTWPSPALRGLSTFCPPSTYPYKERLRKNGRKNAIVELAVDYSVPDLREYVICVEECGGGKPREVLFKGFD